VPREAERLAELETTAMTKQPETRNPDQPLALSSSAVLGVVRGWWRAWRHRRYWTAERQLENLRNMVQGDHRWLAHDKVADALTTRYLAALAPDWMSRVHACPANFRREIGLEPQHAFKVAEPAEVLARAQRLERGEPIYVDGPLPERGWD
jgi:hypothetical protein